MLKPEDLVEINAIRLRLPVVEVELGADVAADIEELVEEIELYLKKSGGQARA